MPSLFDHTISFLAIQHPKLLAKAYQSGEWMAHGVYGGFVGATMNIRLTLRLIRSSLRLESNVLHHLSEMERLG